jgi:hypothetical protein
MASAAVNDRRRLAPITKPIPSTGERIPVIGLGTNQYSVEKPEEMAGLQEVLETMVKLGGSVLDTARVYGRAEEVIGELVERMGNRIASSSLPRLPFRGSCAPPIPRFRPPSTGFE